MVEWANDFLLTLLLLFVHIYIVLSYVWSYQINKAFYSVKRKNFHTQKKSERYGIYVVLILFFFLSPFFLSYYILKNYNQLKKVKHD